MTTDEFLERLELAWKPARVIGALGGAKIEDMCDHAAGFIPAAFRVDSNVNCVDIGSGVGLPGIFLASALPNSRWTLVDASERRCDIAERAVTAVGLAQRVSVVHERADVIGRSDIHRRSYDLVVSRLFGPVSETVECGMPLVKLGGSLVASCAREMVTRWREADFNMIGGHYIGSWVTDSGVYVQVDGVDGLQDRFPRQPPARRRSPLLNS